MRLIDTDKLKFPNIAIFDMKLHGVTVPMVRLLDLKELMPTVDAVPVKHGRWAENKYGLITCSKCGNLPLEAMTGSLITMHYEPCESKYCPHCGAKMDLEGLDLCTQS